MKGMIQIIQCVSNKNFKIKYFLEISETHLEL